MNTLQKIEKANLEKLSAGKRIDTFSQGDTVRVGVRIVEGNTERVQAFEGVCIGNSRLRRQDDPVAACVRDPEERPGIHIQARVPFLLPPAPDDGDCSSGDVSLALDGTV